MPTDQCYLCKTGYAFNGSSNVCVRCGNNCAVCGGGAQNCSVCQNGYYLNNSDNENNGSCVSCLPGCVTCISGQECLQCGVGLYFVQALNMCVQCAIGCNDCVSLLYCTQCQTGFYLLQVTNVDEYQVCEMCQSPCLMCISSSQCTLCGPKFTLSHNGTCLACPQGCLICGSQGQNQVGCQSCDQGYALAYYKGQKTLSCQQYPQFCSQCKSVINNHTFSSYVQCTSCPQGWTMTNPGACYLCGSTPQTTGCAICTSNGACQTCFSGYKFNSTQGLCTLSNYKIQQLSETAFMGASIGLGCLLMILIIMLLVIKLNKPKTSSSLDLNASQITQI